MFSYAFYGVQRWWWELRNPVNAVPMTAERCRMNIKQEMSETH